MENGIAKPMLRSLLVSYVLSGILLAVLAFALYQLRLKEGQVNICLLYTSCVHIAHLELVPNLRVHNAGVHISQQELFISHKLVAGV